MSKHVKQLHKQLMQVCEDVLGCKISLMDLNAYADLFESQRKWPAIVKTFHTDGGIIGVMTLRADTKIWFSDFNQANTEIRKQKPGAGNGKCTVLVYWRTWVHYGTFTHIHRTLRLFLENHVEKNPSDPLECAICLEENDSIQVQGAFKCGHAFCRSCVARMYGLATKACPLCRKGALWFKNKGSCGRA
jgi:hypothetical protein